MRTLREELSAYLARASGGETIRITDRGRPIAVIAPLPTHVHFVQGVAAGWVKPGSGSPPVPASPQAGLAPSLAALDEDRGG